MLFDSPEVKKLINQDKEFLSNGKIDWESKLLRAAKDLMTCYAKLSRYEDYIDDFCDDFDPDPYSSSYQYKTDLQISEEIENLERSLNGYADNEQRQDIAQKIWKLKELKRSREGLAKLINSIADRDHNNNVEHIAGQVKNWTKAENQYSWDDVALSMLKFPESVLLGYDVCPDCGEKRIKIFFYSPEWTWAMMCGVGGEMIICPNCKNQAEFNEKMRN